jgi:omega-6 fatty acid desaturase (delta-12 desaturase)
MEVKQIPSRKELKQLLKPYEIKNNHLALFLFVMDYTIFFIGQCLVVTQSSLLIKLLGCFIIFIASARLFIIGHDACHGCFTDNEKMNKWLGRFAFLPTMTVFRGWVLMHNTTHHGFTNLATTKDLWIPISIDAYKSRSRFQQFLYRLFHSHIGLMFFYIVEAFSWWRTLYIPSIIGKNTTLLKFRFDSLFVLLTTMTWLVSFYVISNFTEQSYLLLLMLSFVIPFVLSNMSISFATYIQHTNQKVKWYKSESEWADSMPHITATVHVRFSDFVSAMLHHVMEHPAHHLDMAIPCYNLKAAQQKLEEVLAEQIVIQDFSWKWYLECTRVCKLYDFEKHEWVGFSNEIMR